MYLYNVHAGNYCVDYLSRIAALESLPLHYYPLVHENESTLLTFDQYTNLTSAWTLNITASVISSKYNLSQTATEPGLLIQVINFQYNISDEGFYILHLYFGDPYNLYAVLRTQGYRCEDHYSYASYYLNLYNGMLLAVFPFALTTFSKLSMYIVWNYV